MLIPLMVILTLLSTELNFEWTETFLPRFIPIYFQLLAAGIYIGFTKARNKFLHGAVVGLLLDLSIRTYAYLKVSTPFHFDLTGLTRVLKYTVVCAVVAWLTGKITERKIINAEAENKING